MIKHLKQAYQTHIRSHLKRAYRNSSKIVWAMNFNHLLWGWYFLNYELPTFYVGTVGFAYPGYTVFWGYTFITVALLSIASDFFSKITGTILMLPQQMVIMYGVTETIRVLVNSQLPGSLILSLCWFGPLALMHSIAIITRYKNSQEQELAERIEELVIIREHGR